MESPEKDVLIALVDRLSKIDYQVTQDAITVAAIHRAFCSILPENSALLATYRQAVLASLEQPNGGYHHQLYADIIQRLKEM